MSWCFPFKNYFLLAHKHSLSSKETIVNSLAPIMFTYNKNYNLCQGLVGWTLHSDLENTLLLKAGWGNIFDTFGPLVKNIFCHTFQQVLRSNPTLSSTSICCFSIIQITNILYQQPNQVRVPAFAVDLSGGKYLGSGGRDYPHMVRQ